ncbi:hypothetical protein ACJMK2_019555 [Sinanodonta woodiana]|uniref:BPL/LPL catalytic domain-containing protein n=1 Tax=Sinanodonta woodiana TaxID=1069815 RepID=A0ABD3TYE8_SINWO
METSYSRFCTEEAKKYLTTKWMGRNIFYKKSTETTMDDAERGALVQGYPHGTVFIAETQTNGRSSKGRQWEAKSFDNLYMSYIVYMDKMQDITYPDYSLENDLDVAASLATFAAVTELGVQGVTVKWLNDLWVRGHKLQGALVEYKGEVYVNAKKKILYIIGIGLNVNGDIRRQNTFSTVATNIMSELNGTLICREKLFASISNNLEKFLSKSRAELMELYTQHQTFAPGDLVKVSRSNQTKPSICKVRGISNKWGILLQGSEDTEVWEGFYNTISIRPYLSRTVYIYSGANAVSWSAKELWITLNALVNRSLYDVQWLVEGSYKQGVPNDAVLVVIGELLTLPVDSVLVNQVRKYVEQGGSYMGIGSGCHVLYPPHGRSHIGNEFDYPNPFNFSNITVSTQNGPKTIVSLSASENSLKNLHPNPDEMSVFGHYCDKDGSAHQANQDGSAYQTNQDDVKEPAIAFTRYGNGHVCLCGPNMEVTYAGLVEHRMLWKCPGSIGLQQSSVFQRDLVFMEILKKLDLE